MPRPISLDRQSPIERYIAFIDPTKSCIVRTYFLWDENIRNLANIFTHVGLRLSFKFVDQATVLDPEIEREDHELTSTELDVPRTVFDPLFKQHSDARRKAYEANTKAAFYTTSLGEPYKQE